MIGKLISGIIVASCVWYVGTHPETAEFAKVQSAHAASSEKMSTDPSPQLEDRTEALTASPAPVTEVEPVARDIDVPTNIPPAPAVPQIISVPPATDNETIIWNRLISEGYTREQTAGIMGNLQQEHNFKTADVPGGLGIAQWMGGRRAALMARGDYLNINVQLDHLIHELNTVEGAAKAAIVASGLEGATAAFQNKFERCNPYYCHLDKRLGYAYAILGRH